MACRWATSSTRWPTPRLPARRTEIDSMRSGAASCPKAPGRRRCFPSSNELRARSDWRRRRSSSSSTPAGFATPRTSSAPVVVDDRLLSEHRPVAGAPRPRRAVRRELRDAGGTEPSPALSAALPSSTRWSPWSEQDDWSAARTTRRNERRGRALSPRRGRADNRRERSANDLRSRRRSGGRGPCCPRRVEPLSRCAVALDPSPADPRGQPIGRCTRSRAGHESS